MTSPEQLHLQINRRLTNRRDRNHEPSTENALAIYNAVMSGSDESLKQEMKRAIKLAAELTTWRTRYHIHESSGVEGMSDYHENVLDDSFDRSIVNGINVPVTFGVHSSEHDHQLYTKLRETLGSNVLDVLLSDETIIHNRGIIGWLAGDKTKFVLNLDKIACSLSNPILFKDFPLDESHAKQKAYELGYDYEELKQKLKKAFKGTVGRPGQPGFGVLIDKLFLSEFTARPNDVRGNAFQRIFATQNSMKNFPKDWNKYLANINGEEAWLLDACQRHPGDEAFLKDLEQLRIDHQIMMERYPIAQQRTGDPTSVIVIGDKVHPVALRIMAQILNFQGALHYLPREQQK